MSMFRNLIGIESVPPEPEYTPITCITGTGTQYCDSTYTPTSEHFKIEAKYLITSNNGALFGAYYASSAPHYAITLYLTYANLEVYIGSTSGPYRVSHSYNNIYEVSVDANNGNATVVFNNNTTTTTYSTPLRYCDGLILAQRNLATNNVEGHLRGSLYYLKLYDNDVLVRDFIPVLDGNGVPCLYDKVEREFHYNLGTGTFNYET